MRNIDWEHVKIHVSLMLVISLIVLHQAVCYRQYRSLWQAQRATDQFLIQWKAEEIRLNQKEVQHLEELNQVLQQVNDLIVPQ